MLHESQRINAQYLSLDLLLTFVNDMAARIEGVCNNPLQIIMSAEKHDLIDSSTLANSQHHILCIPEIVFTISCRIFSPPNR